MVALWGPMAIDLYRAKFGPKKKWWLYKDGWVSRPVI